ncbi:MAG: hypothetical protein AB7F21_12855 [Desulfuromonadales bacterium]
MDQDINKFITSIGATEPSTTDEIFRTFRQIFKRSNYFILNGSFIIVKISRSKKPFWGVGKDYIDFLNSLENYHLVLLSASSEGWVFNKNEINQFINSKKWNLREEDNNYKINMPLPDKNSFLGPKGFFRKSGIKESS